MEKKKPLGVVLIALWSAIWGLVSTPVGCTMTLASGLPKGGTLFVLFGFVFLLSGVFLLAVAYGLWTLQPWGRIVAWWTYLLFIPLGALIILPIFPGQQMTIANTVMQVIGILVDVVVIAYLSGDEIVQLFERGDSHWHLADERQEPQ